MRVGYHRACPVERSNLIYMISRELAIAVNCDLGGWVPGVTAS
jgi:hypothetical protein